MIYKETQVHFLDINEGKSYIGTAESLFRHYAHKIHPSGDHDEIVFNDQFDNVKITDWTGWTNLVKIERFLQPNWYHLIPNESKYSERPDILVSSDTLIPIYDSENIVKGFHGETKFAFHLKKSEAICNGDKIRFTKLLDEDGNDHQFSSVAPVYSFSPAVGYKIYTVSGFFNASVFHLYGGTKDNNLAYK